MHSLRACIACLLVAGVGAPAAAAPDPNVVGSWVGTLDAMGAKLRVVFHVKRAADGSLSATMDSPDQGATGIPASTVAYAGGVLTVAHAALGATFKGTITADGAQVKGEFTQGGMTFPLVLKRTDKPVTLDRPQEPKKPYPYTETEVTYPNRDAPGVTIAGTLTAPRGNGPFPAALLVAGSGPNNRDEAVFGHKPFMVLADYLTRRGIAVLRVDKRGVGKTTGNGATATSVDYASDVEAGIAFLRSRRGIDPKRIGLIGHSEGGLIGPMVAARNPGVSFLVSIAGTAVDGKQIMLRQGELIEAASGATPEQVAQSRRDREELMEASLDAADAAAAHEAVRKVCAEQIARMSEAERKAIQGREKELTDAAAAQVAAPWTRFFMAYDPAPALGKVKCPILCLFGEKDLQVPVSQNESPTRKALAGNKAAQVRVLAGHNHLMQRCATGSPGEYAGIAETMSPVALKAIGDWVVAQTAKPAPKK